MTRTQFAFCPYCGAKLTGHETVCPNCGKPLSQAMTSKPSYNQLFSNPYKEGMKRYQQQRGGKKSLKAAKPSLWQRWFHKR
jgi:predicted amidophosphoribosyltransferase